MDRPEKEVRSLRKRAKSWLASLSVRAAQGPVDIHAYGDWLKSVFKPFIDPGVMQEALNTASSRITGDQCTETIKKRVVSRLTPAKLRKRMLGYPCPAPQEQKDTRSPTIGKMLIIWAVFTGQSVEEFFPKIIARVTKLYVAWRDVTGCCGLSDEECALHPRELAEFWSGFLRTLIQATPETNLLYLARTGTGSLAEIIGKPDLQAELDKLLHQVTEMITADTVWKMNTAFEANPKAMARINIPELHALVLREEIRLGWNKTSKNQITQILEKGLSPKIKKAVGGNQEVIRSSLESVGRKGLFNNLIDALDGKLKPRFIETIRRFIEAVVQVKSTWNFAALNSLQENVSSIQAWLFRR